MQYAIHEDLFNNVKKKLNRISNKCSRYGNDFVFNIVGEEMRKDKKGCYNKFIIIEVEGTAHVDGWEFVAALDINKSGNIIRRCNNDIDIPERFRNSENICDHCGTKRPRNTLYIIRNTETGDFKQVGGTCLASYTHGLDMELVVAWLDGITELEKNDGVVWSGGKTYYSVEDVIRYANIITNKVGYFKSSDYALSTKTLVATMLRRDVYASTLEKRIELINNMLENHKIIAQFFLSDFINNIDEEVNNIIDYYKTCDDTSEFAHNVNVMLENGYVEYKHIGYLCYLPQGYAKHIEREIKRAERIKQKHEHWGEVGKRYKNIAIKGVKRVTCFETAYGYMNIWNITIDDDTVLTWKTSSFIKDDANTISFTVKAHNEYNGIKQTEVTRCKIA